MNESTQKSTYYTRYKEIAEQKGRECYAKNKEKISVSKRKIQKHEYWR